jgi:hypothetical protein
MRYNVRKTCSNIFRTDGGSRPPDLFPDPGPYPGSGSEEPGGFPLLPGAEDPGPEDEGELPAQQGLYVTLPAEQLTLAGIWRSRCRES